MRTISRIAASALATTLLAAPVAATVPAQADTGSSTVAPVQAQKAKKLKLSLNKKFSHYGQPGVTVTAKVKGKGTVKFTQNGTALGTVKIKKGKASISLPQANTPGVYKVKAKWKKSTAKTKVTVFDSSLSLSAVNFTVSKAASAQGCYQSGFPTITGTVKYKNAVATTGWVDIYKNGNVKGGASSPDFVNDAIVGDNGAFEFDCYAFLERVADNEPVGTYTYQAFYTDDAGFDDYIYSSPLVVTVTP